MVANEVCRTPVSGQTTGGMTVGDMKKDDMDVVFDVCMVAPNSPDRPYQAQLSWIAVSILGERRRVHRHGHGTSEVSALHDALASPYLPPAIVDLALRSLPDRLRGAVERAMGRAETVPLKHCASAEGMTEEEIADIMALQVASAAVFDRVAARLRAGVVEAVNFFTIQAPKAIQGGRPVLPIVSDMFETEADAEEGARQRYRYELSRGEMNPNPPTVFVRAELKSLLVRECEVDGRALDIDGSECWIDGLTDEELP